MAIGHYQLDKSSNTELDYNYLIREQKSIWKQVFIIEPCLKIK